MIPSRKSSVKIIKEKKKDERKTYNGQPKVLIPSIANKHGGLCNCR